MPRACTFLLMSCLLAMLAGTTFAQTSWVVPTLNTSAFYLSNPAAVTYDDSTHKLYMGHYAGDDRLMGLLVCDVDATGTVNTVNARSYSLHTMVNTDPKQGLNVGSIVLDKRHNKLFIAVFPKNTGTFRNPLVMYSLDANGEPTGSPQVFDIGNVTNSAYAMVLHPTLNRLYIVGFGGDFLYARDLDANGVPTGAPLSWAVGTNGKKAISIASDASKIYMGGYPSLLEVASLDANGNMTGAARSYSVPGGPSDYLFMSANSKGVYFKKTADNSLTYWPLDATKEPTGTPINLPTFKVQACYATPSYTLITAEATTFTDVISLATPVDGVRLKEYALNTDGSVGNLIRQTDKLSRYSAACIGNLPNSPDAAAALVSLGNLYLGNRYKGLSIRARLTALDAPGNTEAICNSLVSFNDSVNRWLKVSYSTRYNKLYATDGTNLCVYDIDSGTIATVAWPLSGPCIVVDDNAGVNGKVYVMRTDKQMEVRDLAANGMPPSTTGTLTATGMNNINALCLNSVTHHIYISGNSGTAGLITGTNYIRLPGTPYFRDSICDSVNNRVYVASSNNGTGTPAGHQNLWVWRLNTDGTLASTTPDMYNDGLPAGTGSTGVYGYLQSISLNRSKNRLYLGGYPAGRTPMGGIVTYTLDTNGDPTGTPVFTETTDTAYKSTETLLLSNDKTKLYATGYGNGKIFVYSLDANGDLSAPPIYRRGVSANKLGSFLQSVDDTKLFIGYYPSKLEVVELDAFGYPIPKMTASFTMASQTFNYGAMRAGDTSPWNSLDPSLQNLRGLKTGKLTISGGAIANAVVEFDLGLDQGGSAPTPLVTLTTSTQGSTAAVVLPSYGIEESELANLAELMKTETMRLQMYHDTIPVADRLTQGPTSFLTSAGGYYPLSSAGDSYNTALDTFKHLGFNTTQVTSTYLPGSTVRQYAANNNINKFRYAVYAPPSYFDYRTECFVPGFQENWVAGHVTQATNSMGASPAEVGLFHMADEPAYAFPASIDEVLDTVNHPTYIGVFRSYLQSKGLTPAFFGQATWDTVNPVKITEATTLEKKRGLYWTAKFYAESLAKGFAATTTALKSGFNQNILVTTNLNNWPGRFFVPSPERGTDGALGFPDWFELGRKNSVSCIWSEDWLSDHEAQAWSMYGDLLRCAARESTNNMQYGGYIVGKRLGDVPDGGKFKIMSLVGHGGKAIEAYTYGPNYVFGDGWSEMPNASTEYARAMNLLKKSEPVLYPGQPRTGTVAILVPKESDIWEATSTRKPYYTEIYGIHYAMMHEQFPVDFVDQQDIEDGKLTTYGYSVLYLTGPNLSAAAQTAVANWVNAGHTLVLTPGACVADEYNEPISTLTSMMGATWPAGGVPRDVPAASQKRTEVAISDARFGVTSDTSLIAPYTLTPTTGTVLGTFADGTAAIVEKANGAGRVLTYGYYAGVSYMKSIVKFNLSHIQERWRDSNREVLTMPARVVNAAKFADVDVDLVETALLESTTNGIGITLLNWKGTPYPTITVSVNKATMPTAIRTAVDNALTNNTLQIRLMESDTTLANSATPGVLNTWYNGTNEIQVTIPLTTVDVMTLTW